jgi:hypothetical protein
MDFPLSSCTLRFVAANDLVSAGVRAGEFGFPYSHVEFVLDDETVFGAHFRTGVARSLSEGAHVTGTRTVVLTASEAQIDLLCAFLQAQEGKPYDIEAIVSIAAGALLGPRNWRSSNSWMCSELVTAALENSGIISTLADEASHISPRDVMLILSARSDARWHVKD